MAGTSQEMNELAGAGQTKEQGNGVNDVNNGVQGDTAGNEPTNDDDGDQANGGDHTGLNSELKKKEEEIGKKDEKLRRIKVELERLQEEKDRELKCINSELKQKQEETDRKDEELKSIHAELKCVHEEIDRELKRLNPELKLMQEEIQKKDKELKRINSELKQKQEETDRKDEELKSLNAELKWLKENTEEERKRLNSKLKQKQEETDKKEEELKRYADLRNKMTEELSNCNGHITSLQMQGEEAKSTISKFEEQLVRRKCDIDDLLQQLTQLSAEKMEVDENNKKYQEMIGENKSEIEELKISLEQQSKTFAAEKKIIVDANKKCHKIIGAHKSEIEKLNISLSAEKKAKSEKTEIIKTLEVNLKRQRDQLDNEMKREKNKMQEEVRKWYGLYQSVSNQHRAMQNDNANLKAELDRCKRHMKEQVAMNNELKSERDGYILRLSEVVSTRLTANNPNIADLSDENRPTKLAEMYSEIYDNEWTDAYTPFGDDIDKRGILLLRDFLKRTFEICQEIRNNQVSWIESVTFTSICTTDAQPNDKRPQEDEENQSNPDQPDNVTTGTNNHDKTDPQPEDKPPQENKENQSNMDEPVTINPVSDNHDTINEQPSDIPLKVVKENQSNMNMTKSTNNGRPMEGPKDKEEKQTNMDRTDNDSFDNKKHNVTDGQPNDGPQHHEDNQSYTRKQNKCFAVKLPEDLIPEAITKLKAARRELSPHIMPVLCKELPVVLASEVGIELTEDKCDLRRYLSSCVKFCWLMGLQTPPCYLQYDEDGSKFDRKIYKEYMKRGGVIDYVVWPPMLIHEGGALLGKGVAQGKD